LIRSGCSTALGQHLLDALVVAQASQLEIGRLVELDAFIELGEPFHRPVRHAVFVLEDAAHPQDRRRLELLDADLLADQIGRLGDALGRVDEDEAVAKAAMQKDRNGGERETLVARDEIGRARHLGDVELLIAQEAPMARRRIHLGQDREIDPVCLDRALFQGTDDLVIAAGEGEGNVLGQRICLLVSSCGARRSQLLK
jgi:hypothetical protein